MKWIKNGVFFGILICPFIALALMSSPKSLAHLDLELPFRCTSSTPEEGEGIASSIALSNLDFTVRLPSQTSLLPRYQVNGFSFSNKTVDVAVADLLKEADIKVVADEGKYVTLSARDLRGELSSVLEELMKQGGLFYTYQSDTKTLLLTHKVKAIVQVPQNKFVMMAVLDALNGGHFEPLSIDWNKYQITLTLTRPELTQVQDLMALMVKEKYLLAVQVKLYEIKSQNLITHWQNVLNRFGIRNVSVLQNGLVGQALTLVSSASEDAFFDAMKGSFLPSFVATGKVVVPNGWRTRFNFNQCAPQMLYPELSLFLRTSIKKKNEAQTVITLDSSSGEVASFDITSNLDQKVVILGVPIPNQPNKEVMMFLQFQFIQLIKKGEQND